MIHRGTAGASAQIELTLASGSLELLRIVAEQDIATGYDGHVVVDLDMRYGRKTSSLKFDGYKANLSTQNRSVDKVRS